MEINLSIPTWLLWSVGGIATFLILCLAFIGIWFIVSFWNWKPFG